MRYPFLFLFFPLLILASCTPDESDRIGSNGQVNIYTHRHYEVDRELYREFEQETGIRVNVVKASADELIVRLENEGKKSPADLLVTVDAGRLVMAKEKGLLQATDSEILESNVPAHLRDPEGYWYAQTLRARVIVYSRDRVDADELSSYEALTDDKWRGRILTRSSSNIYNQSLLASIIAHKGSTYAKEWAEGLVANFARSPKGNDSDQIIALASGQGDIAIVNSYYVGKLYQSDEAGRRAAAEAVGVFFPNSADRGSHINVSGAGITRHAPNRASAQKLLEFLSRPEIQSRFAEANAEFPVHQDAKSSPILLSWGEWKQDELPLNRLGELNSEAVSIFDVVGWK